MILTNETIVTSVSNEVKTGLNDYLNFWLKSIGSPVQASGSGTHDGYNGTYSNAISNWSELINADSNAVLSTHTAIGSLDKKLTTLMLGVTSNTSGAQKVMGVYNVN